ncbi:MAG: LLM class flavin-dependent oxidoreductase [Chromatiales bacterium]|nr:LLM class flavin-dependent oxidoreductase [Chromatiales bacterium]
MEVDIILEPDLTPRQIVELGQAAEKLGIRAVWTSNYFAHWDPFISLVPLAQTTSRIKMGPLAVSPFEMHPLKIANGLLTLNEMSDGRAVIAVGAGEGNIDAMALAKPPKVVRAVREALEIIIAAANGRLGEGYKGEDFSVNFPCAYPWLTASPPCVYGTAYRPMMMRMEGRVADGVYIGCTPPEFVGPAMDAVREGYAKRSEPARDFRVNTFWGWHIKADRTEAYRESRRELPWRARKLDEELLALFLSEDEVALVRENYDAYVAAYFNRSGHVDEVPEDVSNRLCEGLTSTGGLEDLDREIERFRLFGKAGLTEIALRLHDDPMDGLRIIGEQVVPALR